MTEHKPNWQDVTQKMAVPYVPPAPPNSQPVDPKWLPQDPALTDRANPQPVQWASKPKLHPMQWITYIIVIITCIATLYALLETYLFIQHVQQAAQQFVDHMRASLDGIGG
jgi:hypothetical protein